MWERQRGDGHDRLENQPLFEMGQVVMTPGVAQLVDAGLDPLPLVLRHGKGDWGDLDDEDRRSNEAALNRGGRLFSAFNLSCQARLWIITEWDRSYTTLLLPSEY